MINPQRYFIVHKPYKMVSQFKSPDKVRLLGSLDFDFPEGIHAIGRLDNNSEGLLILTTDKRVTRLLFESDLAHRRTYLLQVRNVMTEETVQRLRSGVDIKVEQGALYRSVPEEVHIVEQPPGIRPLQPHYRQDIPHTWLTITLTEGKFHQVRKMVAAVNHQCKRLIRISIEDLVLGSLEPGKVKEIGKQEFFRLLHIEEPE